ncbi:MAG: Bax inhibitor-1/YccA family protein [Acidimicrobiales bacterium]|nr:Bax inhibitor-1/YccA family protein [Acidimicrobiales bacterium]
MRSSNPALNEKAFERAGTETGWAAATEAYAAPAYRGPVAGDDTMTLNGVAWASGALIVLVMAAGVFGWSSSSSSPDELAIPGWLPIVAIGGLGVAILTIFKPHLARFTAPVYAILEGALLGAISKLYNDQYDGIVVQAIGLTVGVFLVMLFLFSTRIIRVTEKLRAGIVAATLGVMLVYVVSMVVNLFGGELPLLHDSSALGIGISLLIVGIAAFNLLLDFDFVEKGVEAGAPKHLEWYAAFGLLVTLIWLYLELLRLLAKLQSRD